MSHALPATGIAPDTPPATGWRDLNGTRWQYVALVAIVAFQASMVFTRAINWDEFWYFSHVAQYVRTGEITDPLQSLHLRLFAWLAGLPGNDIAAITTARLVMLGCEIATMTAIYRLAQFFVSRREALLAALLYVSAGYVFQHGFSFRTDPMATAGLMWALVLLAHSRLDTTAQLGFALLTAIAALISIKVVLYLPAFAGLAWLRWSRQSFSRVFALRLVLLAVLTLVVFAGLYLWHIRDMPPAGNAAGDMIEGAGQWMFFLGIPPYLAMMMKSAAFSPILAILIVLAPALTWKSDLSRDEKIALTGLWLPVTTLFFYTNTAGYYYVFMLAPVVVGCAMAIRRACERYRPGQIALVLLALATALFALEDRSTIARQHALVDAASALPEGTAYFDKDGMLAGLDKANNFLTPWGISQYRQRNVPSYRTAMEQRTVPVLLANDDIFLDTMKHRADGLLLPADQAALRDNYIAFYGPLYLAGKTVDIGPVASDFLVPGTYTVLDGPIRIDGTSYRPDDTVEIERGTHILEAPAGKARLQWGNNLSPPDKPWTEGSLYVSF